MQFAAALLIAVVLAFQNPPMSVNLEGGLKVVGHSTGCTVPQPAHAKCPVGVGTDDYLHLVTKEGHPCRFLVKGGPHVTGPCHIEAIHYIPLMVVRVAPN